MNITDVYVHMAWLFLEDFLHSPEAEMAYVPPCAKAPFTRQGGPGNQRWLAGKSPN